MNDLIIASKNREEYDANLLAFLKKIYDLKKKDPRIEIYRINLTRCAEMVGLKSIPTQDILTNKVNWSVEPTIDTARMVHDEFIAYNREMKKRSEERTKDLTAGMDASPAAAQGGMTEDMVRRMIAEAMGKPAVDPRVAELQEQVESLNETLRRKCSELEEMKSMLNIQFNDAENMRKENAALKARIEELEQSVDHHELYEDMLKKEINNFATSVMQIQEAWTHPYQEGNGDGENVK